MTPTQLLEAARTALAEMDTTLRTFNVYDPADKYLGQVTAYTVIDAEEAAFYRWTCYGRVEEVA